MADRTGRAVAYGAWLLVLCALVGLVVAAINAFSAGNGIAFSLGAYIVLGSTAILFVAAIILAVASGWPRWLTGILAFLILLDLIGSGAASYFLDAWIVLGAMAAGIVAWILHLLIDPARPRRADPSMQARAA
ncbi:hypothetical protein [Jiella sp. M17.18]|uniref:hypothetical protein n=1 Tax=Jiella sp. M17.18 TaxID=3234247 RepID=UPI0034E0146C